jgi:hypothetical protein
MPELNGCEDDCLVSTGSINMGLLGLNKGSTAKFVN